MSKHATSFVSLLLVLALGACGGGEPGDGGNGGGAPEKPAAAPEEPQGQPAGEGKSDLPAPVREGLKRAEREKKLLIVHYHDEECNFCHEMDQVLALETVKRKLEEFVFVTLEMRRDKGAMKYAEDNYLQYSPTFLAYAPGGKQLEYSLEGFQPEQVFLVELENFKRIAAGEQDQAPPPTDHPSYGKG